MVWVWWKSKNSEVSVHACLHASIVIYKSRCMHIYVCYSMCMLINVWTQIHMCTYTHPRSLFVGATSTPCMHVHTRICMLVMSILLCIHVCVCVCVNISVFGRVCARIFVCVYAYGYVYVSACMRVYACVCVCVDASFPSKKKMNE
jgi:hypothetical protein